MLLINRITSNNLHSYRRLVMKCLKSNISNPYLTEILVFLEEDDDNLPKNNKVKYITKKGYSNTDIITYSKELSNSEYIIFSSDLHIFGPELKIIKNIGDYIENKKFIFFKREYNLNNKIINNAENDIIRTEKSEFKTPKIISKGESKLDVIIVSVNYNKYLPLTLENNTKIFDNITVVTSKDDIECQIICKRFNVNCIICENIVENGLINKSLGLNSGIKSLLKKDWILILDADIIVNSKIDINELNKSNLYTSSRYIIEDLDLYKEYKSGNKNLSEFKFESDKGIGFFQLFNFKMKKSYPDSNYGRYSESTWSDVIFKKKFNKIESLDIETIHLGKPYQKWEKVNDSKFHIDISEIDINTLKKSKRDDNIKPKLAVITSFFNPNNYINIKYNYLKFSEKIKEKADLFPIELSFNNEFFIEDSNVIRINGNENNILWQKEKLLNIALENLPKEYTNVAWIDCDVLFENENWVNEVNEGLKNYKVLQLYEKAKRLDEKGDIERISEGVIKRISKINYVEDVLIGIPGFAWAIRREVIDKIKFLDTQIIGGGDALMFYSFFGMNNTTHHNKMNKDWFDFYMNWFSKSYGEIDESVNYISGSIVHLYHGKMINRNYDKRYEILSKERFNPNNDLITSENGLWELKSKELSNKMSKYFESRNEDDNIIDINKYFDNIYVLNLDRRTDRYEKVKEKMDQLGINFERFSAIDGNNISDSEHDFSKFVQGRGMIENKYALACLRSHIEIIKDAKKNGYKRILIFEDDVLISKDINVHIQKLRNIDDWKLLYLGSSQYNWNVVFIEDFFFSKQSLGTFAYAIDESIYDEVLNKSISKSIDNILSDLQSQYHGDCYTFYPNICISDVSESDIRSNRDQKSHSVIMRWNLLNNYV